jgi:hypothetical protein
LLVDRRSTLALTHRLSAVRHPTFYRYITEEQWAPPTYPVWAHGAGYVVTRRLAKTMAGGIPHLVNDGKILPKSEDVATGAWIEYQKTTLGEDVRYINDPRYARGICIARPQENRMLNGRHVVILHSNRKALLRSRRVRSTIAGSPSLVGVKIRTL